jgi:hypothetical protein
VVAAGSVAAGGVAAIGAGLLLLGSGVGPRDVIDGVREMFGREAAVAPPAADEDDVLRLQRAVADRIKREGWDDVTSQEYGLLREAPRALRDELRAGIVAREIEGYQRVWEDHVTARLKVAQSAVDFAAGMCSTANPAFGIHYTYYKNVAGGLSEGAGDWWRGRNDKGLLLNLNEGLVHGTLRAGAEIAVDAAAGGLVHNPIGAYFVGQAGKYVVGQATAGFLETTSPLEKNALDAAVGAVSSLPPASPAAASPMPYMAHHEVY